MTEKQKREPKPTFDPEYIRDLSEAVYRITLVRDAGEGSPERMIAKDEDNGEKLRNRAGAYDPLTRVYLKVLGFEPPAASSNVGLTESPDQLATAMPSQPVTGEQQ
jgi:hypothetical protein